MRPGALHPIDSVEMASRLSFFLWSSVPDDALLNSAARADLSKPHVLEATVRRMLADPRAARFVSDFAGQWLQLRNLKNVRPNSAIFPDFDDNLRQDFRQETEMLFASVLAEHRSVLDLQRADYTFLNERLAKHYGIEGEPETAGCASFQAPHVTGADARREMTMFERVVEMIVWIVPAGIMREFLRVYVFPARGKAFSIRLPPDLPPTANVIGFASSGRSAYIQIPSAALLHVPDALIRLDFSPFACFQSRDQVVWGK